MRANGNDRRNEQEIAGEPKRSTTVTSRRTFLVNGAAGVTALALRLRDPAWAPEARIHTTGPLTPDDALTQLMDGNRRFVSKRLTSCGEDLAARRHDTLEKQEPFAAVLSCADSRVPVELIFDQSIGRVFVTRVAGNVAPSEIIASLEYAVAELGTPLVVVMGHATCGAVKAAIGNEPVPGQISALFGYIRPAIDQAGTDLEAAIKANARIQARIVSESSPVMAEQVKKKTLRIVASYYDLATGAVTLLDKT